MKLFEFTGLIHVGTVIAANSLEEAKQELKSWGNNVWIEYSDFIEEEPTDIQLIDERKATSLEDEAHFIVD